MKRRLPVVVAAALSAACAADSVSAPRAPAASLAVAAGDSQRVEVGTKVPNAPAVVVRDSAGRAVAGVPVLFHLVGGGGGITDSVGTTDVQGIARLGGWTLGTKVGWQRVVAGATGVTGVVNFDALADPGAPVRFVVVTPPGRGVPGGALSTPVVLRPEDQYGNPVLGNPAHAAVPPRAPTLGIASTLGDSFTVLPDTGYGTTQANLILRWQLSQASGPRSAVVTLGGTSTTLQASTYLPPYRFELAEGNGRVKPMLDTVARVSLRLWDANGENVTNVPVRFRVVAGGGSIAPITFDSAATDTAVVVSTHFLTSVASIGPWRFGTESSRQVVRVDVAGVGSADFVSTATGTPVYLQAAQLEAWDHGNCALAAEARAYCWGEPPARGLLPQLVAAPPLRAVSLSNQSVCGLTTAGGAYCDGDGFRATQSASWYHGTPTLVPSTPAFASLSVGYGSACGLTAAGVAWCWGPYAGRGDAPDATGFLSSLPPAPVSGSATFTRVEHGEFGACGLPADGHPLCWGAFPDTGRVVTPGSVQPRTKQLLVPTPLPAGPAVATFVRGRPLCALTVDGTALCWRTVSEPPSPLGVPLRLAELAVNDSHACGVATDGAVWCWGENDDGQLGDGTFVDRAAASPARVVSERRFVHVAVGDRHTCAVTDDASVYCWGLGVYGELAAGVAHDRNPRPLRAILRIDP